MTNVPEDFRTAIAEVYKLFDISYLMKGTEDDWKLYWERGNKLIQKYGDGIPLLNLITAYAGIIETRLLEEKTGNKTLLWGKDEDYPYPKEERKNGAN